MSTYNAWAWARFLAALDAAGYAIVRKPLLLNRGAPRKPGP